MTFQAGEDLTVTGRLEVANRYQGGPGVIHGGILSTAFDEVQGMACMVLGGPVVTAHLEIDFARPIPLSSVLEFRARIEGTVRRKAYTTSEAFIVEGPGTDPNTPVATSRGLFLTVNRSISRPTAAFVDGQRRRRSAPPRSDAQRRLNARKASPTFATSIARMPFGSSPESTGTTARVKPRRAASATRRRRRSPRRTSRQAPDLDQHDGAGRDRTVLAARRHRDREREIARRVRHPHAADGRGVDLLVGELDRVPARARPAPSTRAPSRVRSPPAAATVVGGRHECLHLAEQWTLAVHRDGHGGAGTSSSRWCRNSPDGSLTPTMPSSRSSKPPPRRRRRTGS